MHTALSLTVNANGAAMCRAANNISSWPIRGGRSAAILPTSACYAHKLQPALLHNQT